MKAAYKWRIQNGLYAYITDEQDNGLFVYDVTVHEREYSGGIIVSGSPVDEGLISGVVSKMTKEQYTAHFNTFKQFISEEYPEISLLDVSYYYNIENDECTASASSLKCSATDIIFEATAVTGDTISVTVTNEQKDPNTGEELRYKLDFVFPIEGGGGGSVVYTSVTSDTIVVTSLTAEEITVNEFNSTNISSENLTSQTIVSTSITSNNATINVLNTTGITANTLNATGITANTLMVQEITVSSITVSSSITANTFIKSGGTGDEYLMADGSVTILSAGTNVHITTGGTEDRKIITISSDDTNTWRKVQVDGSDILGNSVNTNALNLSAGTNITLTNNNGTVTISSENSSTDTKVYQKVISEDDDDCRPLILGKSYSSEIPPTFSDKTDNVYACNKIYASIDTGNIYANNFYINGGGGGVTSITDMMPTGSITMWPGDTAPAGWVICDGSDLGVTKLLSWNVGVTRFTDSKQGQKLGGILAATSANDTWPYYKNHKIGLFRKNPGTASFDYVFDYCLSARVETIGDTLKISKVGWRSEWPSSRVPAMKEFTNATGYDYSKIDLSEVTGTDVTLGKMVCLPDLRQRFPLGRTDLSRYELMVRTWDNIVPSSLKKIYSPLFTDSYDIVLSDVIDANGNKTTARPSGMPSQILNSTWEDRRDEIYDNYLNTNYNAGRTVGETGGELEHILTVDEIPSHTHNIFSYKYASGSGLENGVAAGTGAAVEDRSTRAKGRNSPHNNMPPYLTLNFIIKYI